MSMQSVRPYDVSVDERALGDLRRRLALVRWPRLIEPTGWDRGVDLDFMRRLIAYWRDDFDWRAQERRIRKLPSFIADVHGVPIHFVHIRGRGPSPLPIILTHGWPSTFLEMESLIPHLTDPSQHGAASDDAFDVVVPSVPGFAFSGVGAPWLSTRIDDLWATLMIDVLGYDRFIAHGGDIGSEISLDLAAHHSDRVIGVHVTAMYRTPDLLDRSSLSEDERAYLTSSDEWLESEGAYRHLQRTKPHTLAFSLHDSPVGLAAWIVEKWRSWSDCAGDIESRFTLDQILTTVTIYWVTESAGPAAELYFEAAHDSAPRPTRRIDVPTGLAVFPGDFSRPPSEWAARICNLVRYRQMPAGGHFAALEEPALLAEDIREFCRPLRSGLGR